MLHFPALVCEVIALLANMALLSTVLRVLSALKLVVPRICTLGTVLLVPGIIILTAVFSLLHEVVYFPHVQRVGSAGPAH